MFMENWLCGSTAPFHSALPPLNIRLRLSDIHPITTGDQDAVLVDDVCQITVASTISPYSISTSTLPTTTLHIYLYTISSLSYHSVSTIYLPSLACLPSANCQPVSKYHLQRFIIQFGGACRCLPWFE